jgi:uncharacterized protein YpmS
MKKTMILTFVMFLSCNTNTPFFGKKIECEDCLVTEEKTAVSIAESVLFESYGEDKIKKERPYIVNIENDSIWNIEGNFKTIGIGFGGVFYIKISAKNGKVLDMYHEK